MQPSTLYDIDVDQLAALWDREHLSPADPFSLKHVALAEKLWLLQKEFPDLLELRSIGKSVESRDVFLAEIGTGPETILMWSQMHGDEPTATSAILDILQFLGRHHEQPWVSEILQRHTLLFIPMLNPDGAEVNQRRNAQGLDINRDARALQTPEANLLSQIQASRQPILGFNLHNQNSQITVKGTGKVATISLLALGTNFARSAEARSTAARAKQAASVLVHALSRYLPGHIARYEESFNPTAFGDAFTLKGTSVVLIESGGLPSGQPANFTVKLNFVGLLAVISSLASGKIKRADPQQFDSLQPNCDVPTYDVVLRNAWVLTGNRLPPFRGHVAIQQDRRAKGTGRCIVADLGDLREPVSAHTEIDCSGKLLTPGLIGWDRRQASPQSQHGDQQYFQQGFLSVLQTLSFDQVESGRPPALQDSLNRRVHWGYVIEANEQGNSDVSRDLLARALLSGAVAVVAKTGTLTSIHDQICQRVGVNIIAPEFATSLQVPTVLTGAIERLPRWTSQAARRLGLEGRGVLAPGAAADLVIWEPRNELPSKDMQQYRPHLIIFDGTPIDPHDSESIHRGRFLEPTPKVR